MFICCNAIKTDAQEEPDRIVQKKKWYSWKNAFEEPEHKKALLLRTDLHPKIKECLLDTSIVVITSLLLRNLDDYNQVRGLGDIDNDNIIDSIISIPEMVAILNNDTITELAYYSSINFTNNNLPRIVETEITINNNSIFLVNDIDEDGIKEVGKYFTTGASRFKGLQLISLQKNEWELQGQVIFDLNYPNPKKETRFKKLEINKFALRQITDFYSKDVEDKWIEFKLN